ncbi:sarcolemmal membrane-associated protein-like isoform X3 [Zootermopsis nevadensis]|uniref:sarcolemmal membrane-associated protein-like isoform X3 n=1 Tax=Zootermopsis nevadensis TaxID=136037 RepID=UPI000B8E37B5|nr:sarcolemmal membrane-associated protein-like isoform X3 [Zootermopsis nevadensis]
MVVVSGGWVKSVVYPNCGDVIATTKMAAKAVLICRPNSHPFQERSLTLDQPVKIGRSVARARAAPNNAIFDCKVLSRNHALLWYENGKDTKSSNGTFVNNQRLSKGAEESPPREVCSGDIVQFGVDVMENSRKVLVSVTHGCIVATLKLYLPDGKEAKASPSTSVVSSVGMVPLEDLYQLNQYLQEALQREQLLENKLATLQRLVETTRQASDLGWKALIDEDRLLSRVEILENQLQMYSKNFAEDKLREELRKLQEDKSQYQGTAKESLRKMLQEKLEAVQKMQDIERTLSNTEDECAHLKELCERSQQDLQDLALKYSLQLQKVEELSSKLQETEDQHREVCERLEQEKQELQARLQEQLEAERALQLRLEALQVDGDVTQKQLAALQSHIHSLQPSNNIDSKVDLDSFKSTDSTATQVDIILERIEPDNMKEALQNTQDEIENLRSLLKKSEEEIKESHARVDELHTQLEESRKQEDSNSEQIRVLQERLEGLELDLELDRVENCHENGECDRKHVSLEADSNHAKKLKADIAKLEETRHELELSVEHYVCMVIILKELLAESRGKKRDVEVKQQHYQHELDCAKLKVKKTTEEANMLKQQLQAAQKQMQEKSESVTKLHEQMHWLETSADEVKFQVLQLQERLRDEQQRCIQHSEEAEVLRNQLMEAQQSAKQSRNEAEQMKDRLKAIQEELKRHSGSEDNRSREELIQIRKRCETLVEDNARLKEEYHALEERNFILNRNLEARILQGDSESTSLELSECRIQRDQIFQNLHHLQEEMVIVKECYSQCNEAKTQLTQDLVSLQQEYSNLMSSSSIVLWCCLVPLIIVFLGIIVMFYPSLAFITGTSESEQPQ